MDSKSDVSALFSGLFLVLFSSTNFGPAAYECFAVVQAAGVVPLAMCRG